MEATQLCIIAVSLIIFAFLIFREVFCWYWKINKSITVQKQIRDLLVEIRDKGGVDGNMDNDL